MNSIPRILVVGGGMAGWPLTGLLRHQDLVPTLVEKTPAYGRVALLLEHCPLEKAAEDVMKSNTEPW